MKKYSEDFKIELIKRYTNGETIKSISTSSGVPYSTLSGWIRKQLPKNQDKTATIPVEDDKPPIIGVKKLSKKMKYFLKINDYKKVQELYERIMSRDSNNINAKLMYLKALLAQNKFGEEEVLYNEIMALDCNNIPAKITHMKALIEQKRFDEEEAIYKEIMCIEPNTIPPKFIHMKALFYQRRYLEEQQIYDEITGLNTDDIPSKFVHMRALLAQGHFEEAKLIYNEIIALAPDNIPAKLFYMRALLGNKKGFIDEKLDLLDEKGRIKKFYDCIRENSISFERKIDITDFLLSFDDASLKTHFFVSQLYIKAGLGKRALNHLISVKNSLSADKLEASESETKKLNTAIDLCKSAIKNNSKSSIIANRIYDDFYL